MRKYATMMPSRKMRESCVWRNTHHHQQNCDCANILGNLEGMGKGCGYRWQCIVDTYRDLSSHVRYLMAGVSVEVCRIKLSVKLISSHLERAQFWVGRSIHSNGDLKSQQHATEKNDSVWDCLKGLIANKTEAKLSQPAYRNGGSAS